MKSRIQAGRLGRVPAPPEKRFPINNKPITIAQGRVRVLVHILAPNQRPVQITDDLGSFWANTYAQVKKDLRGRYPKHEWR